jgi:hypothetical protein
MEDGLAALALMDIHPEINRSLFEDTRPGAYDRVAVERYWQALS